MKIALLVPDAWALQEVADDQGIALDDAARDLALLAVMASLAESFEQRIIFKGGAMLRFGYGASRTSRDADATVVKPARSPIPSDEVANAIAAAGVSQFLRFQVPKAPKTDNRHSLDFDRIGFRCADISGVLDVELSYREDAVLPPKPLAVGPPYFSPFEVLALRPVEMAGEKLRTLVQRERATDLSDCVLIEALSRDEMTELPAIREQEFKLVRNGVGPADVIRRIDQFEKGYERDVRPVDPAAPSYLEAKAAAVTLVRNAWPKIGHAS